MRLTNNDLNLLKIINQGKINRRELLKECELNESSFHYAMMRLALNNFILSHQESQGYTVEITKQGKQVMEINRGKI